MAYYGAGYIPGAQYDHPPHHHTHNSYSGGNGYCETERVTEYSTQGPMPGSGYGYNNTAGYGSGYSSPGQGLVGALLGGARSHRSQHTRRRRVRKQYPTGEYYSCSETDSSDDEGRRGRRF